ncbi:hypothetical protein LGH83_12865 [Lichenihabitans sp. PAMC28606]|uniref:hypothetical protein n=1 Tax=Lichenihabitans sp. PAMC28606 TaxID=2880932 RepID=UPI001D09B81A|nr:hypothetical protein [Lichenihabitans sp. PAMC28606]UDL93476.1 hypothetical protein LGH83_12865 [Lichenihabitans sp. PAMC28606]
MMVKFNRAGGTAAVAALALAALVSSDLAASAQSVYRPLTVGGTRQPRQAYVPVAPQAPVYNPYAGPAVLITAPVAFAGRIVSLPFEAINAIFPAQGNSPLTLVGGPVMAAGRFVQLPFRVAQAPFGGPNPFAY